MAGKAVSYQFLDVLAKSVGMDAETVKQALADINQLQTRTQALELAIQDKAPDRDTTPRGYMPNAHG